MTAWHRNSKADTTLLLDTAVSAIDVDQGPERTNLTDHTTYLDEASSTRSALAAPRNVALVVNMRGGWSGTLIELGNAVTYSWRLLFAGGVVYAYEGAALVAEVEVPGLGVEETVLVHWSTREEGASTVSELAVYNFDQGAWAFATATHAASTPTATDTLTIAARHGGASAYSGDIAAFTSVHIGRRFHSTTEAREDWVTESSPAAFTGYARAPAFTGAAAELAIAGEGNLAGPSMLLAGAATRQADQRTTGPFINVMPAAPGVELSTNYPPQFYRATPDAWGLWCIRYLYHGYLGPKVNVARVRVHVEAYDDFGGGVTISPLRFRSYSIADLPTSGPKPEMTYHRSGVTSIAAPTAAGGEWIDLGLVRLARSANFGLSYFALGFLLDAAANEGILFSTAWILNAITVDPFAKNLDGGGLGDVDDKAGP